VLTQKKSTKIESVATGKSSTKLVPKVTTRLFSAPSPCWLRNCYWKLRHCRLQNHERNRFQRWRAGFGSARSPCWLRKSQQKLSRCRPRIRQSNKFQRWATTISEIVNKTNSKGDVWIPKCSQPLLTQKKSTKTQSVATASTKQVLKVTSGFFSTPNPCWLRNC
jgi:hypothetical protein